MGKEAIELARQALQLHTQLRVNEYHGAAGDMNVLARILNHFNDVDDDEVLHLLEQSIDMYRRVDIFDSSMSEHVAFGERELGEVYDNRASRAFAADDMDRSMANLQSALPHFHEALRIYRAINREECVDGILRNIGTVEKNIQNISKRNR